ncbi:hypothetical protein GRF29_1g1123047 [Pseudopithomyces chartarum]|uniref:Uncharacterized protein n=1 Tax=Pseudopithomyces chartarum TaxID=1892770 RepID=A0AAN6M5V7_9PLEO|nr:hypothetical protein GRF29_1g1123047 [Pseudopithomyces chartarum]
MPPRIPVRLPCAASNGTGLPLARAFSSSAPTLALGPESPNYIEVPKPLQPSFPPKPIVKGHLPVPRDIFETRSKIPKESDKFIAQSTRDPKKVAQPGPWSKDAEYRLYKQRLAEARKKALREGVKELHARKVETDQAYTHHIERTNAERRRLAMAPPRAVDVLTQTSISKGVRDFLSNELPSTPRVEFAAQRRNAYERRLARQEAVRRNRLHDLYTNAREFIVNEEQLDEAIELAFGTEEQPMRFHVDGHTSPAGTGDSAWASGPPEGVSERLQKLKGGEGVGLAKERVKKVTEVLTGGKM